MLIDLVSHMATVYINCYSIDMYINLYLYIRYIMIIIAVICVTITSYINIYLYIHNNT